MENPHIAIITRPLKDGSSCGDMAASWVTPEGTTLIMIDGLGHGRQAEKAAQAALEYVGTNLQQPMPELFTGCDRAIRHTRGAAVTVIKLDANFDKLLHAGIGNVQAFQLGDHVMRFSSNYGIVGGGFRKLNVEEAAISNGDLIVIYTDGLKEYFDPMDYWAMLHGPLEELAVRIFEDQYKGLDDGGLLTYRVVKKE